AGLDITKALPVGQLSECHGAILLAATECPHSAVAIVAHDDPAEGLPRKEVHQLGEKRLAGVHRRLQEGPGKHGPSSNRGHQLLPGNPQNSWRSEKPAVS